MVTCSLSYREFGSVGDALFPVVPLMVPVVMTGMGNTAGAVIVAVPGGFGVTSRRRSMGSPGTVMKHGEGAPVAKHCAWSSVGCRSGGLTHVSLCGPGRCITVASPVAPIVTVVPGTGNMA